MTDDHKVMPWMTAIMRDVLAAAASRVDDTKRCRICRGRFENEAAELRGLCDRCRAALAAEAP